MYGTSLQNPWSSIWGWVQKNPIPPVVHIKIAGKWIFIPVKTGINRYWSTSITFTLSPSVFFFPTVSHFRNSWSGLGASFIHDINGLDMQRTLTFSGITPENSENWVKRWQTWFWRCLKDDSLYTLYSGTNPLLKIGDPFQILGPVLESNTSSPNIWHLTVPPEVADLSFLLRFIPHQTWKISWNSHGNYKLQQGHSKRDISSDSSRKRPNKKALTLSGKHRSAMNWFRQLHARLQRLETRRRKGCHGDFKSVFFLVHDHHGS